VPQAVRNGVTLHVQELGAGPPVVMLHGLLVGSMATWYFTTAPLLAQTHRVLLYDLRGHGLSERAKSGYDVETMRADLDAVVSGFTSDPVTLVGHSYGAVVALRFAMARPDRVAKLVLVEAPIPPSRLEELDSFLGKPPEAMAESLPDVLRDALGRQGRQARRFVDSLRFLTTETSLLDDLRGARDVDDSAIAAVECPVLCVYGASSSCLPVGRRIARLAPRARLVELEGGHFLPVEAPAAVGAAIAEFVRG
jgi:pimeloyl-ACP methyl ester carboxylesterase